ncbi:uncharacterized protein LOC132303207 [Cornus florida]|uniref:uncharacterized protein LOC132303207 n=1 Tax=Cornus florida TaxID=4283 RepID=UPI00289E5429|nr:uncharacterized protein LOC132303207 [Cornus florida]
MYPLHLLLSPCTHSLLLASPSALIIMLDRNKNNLCHQSNGTCVSPKSTDFDFWGDQRSDKYDHYGDIDLETDDDRMEFRTQTLPLWKKTRNNNIRYEASPLLPYNHHYSFPSPNSRLQAIIDGRRELMEMIQDLPESSYELSLKDMVKEDDQISEGVRKEDGTTAEREQNFETKVKIKQKNKRNTGRGPIARCESMDSGVFLLKMFFPTSLGLKKKPKTKISRTPSFEGSEKMVRKDWWKMRFLVAGESRNSVSRVNESTSSSSSRSSSSKSNSSTGSSSRSSSSKSNSSTGSSSRGSSSESNSSSSRITESNFTSRRWSFNTKKCKATGQPGCFF